MLLPLTQKDFCILSYSLIHSCHLLETASGSIQAPQLLVPIIRTRVVYLYIWLTSSKSGFQNDFLEFYKRVLENLEEKTWCFLLTYHRDTEGETHRGRHAGREATCGVGDEADPPVLTPEHRDYTCVLSCPVSLMVSWEVQSWYIHDWVICAWWWTYLQSFFSLWRSRDY